MKPIHISTKIIIGKTYHVTLKIIKSKQKSQDPKSNIINYTKFTKKK